MNSYNKIGSDSKESACNSGDLGSLPRPGDPLEKGMITHSSILTPLSMGFLRQEYWTWLPHPPPGDLPNPEIEPMSFMSPALAGRFFITRTTWDTPVGYDVSLKTCETALKVVCLDRKQRLWVDMGSMWEQEKGALLVTG